MNRARRLIGVGDGTRPAEVVGEQDQVLLGREPGRKCDDAFDFQLVQGDGELLGRDGREVWGLRRGVPAAHGIRPPVPGQILARGTDLSQLARVGQVHDGFQQHVDRQEGPSDRGRIPVQRLPGQWGAEDRFDLQRGDEEVFGQVERRNARPGRRSGREAAFVGRGLTLLQGRGEVENLNGTPPDAMNRTAHQPPAPGQPHVNVPYL